MKNHWKKLVAALLVLGTVVFAAGSDFVDRVDSNWPQWFQKGAYFGPTSPSGNVSSSQPLVVNGNASVSGTISSGGQTLTGNESVVGDAGVTGIQQATLGFQIGPAAGLDYLTDQGGVATFDGGMTVRGQLIAAGASSVGVSLNGGAFGTIDTSAAGLLAIGTSTATSIQLGGSGAANVVSVVTDTATAAHGFRIGATNVIPFRSSAGAVDCAGAGITATVAQIIGGVIYTCSTSQTVTLPTAKGASGIVQALPGTPAVGDVFYLHLAENHATNTLTLAANGDASETIYGIATITNGGREWRCRVTNVTSGSEAITCY